MTRTGSKQEIGMRKLIEDWTRHLAGLGPDDPPAGVTSADLGNGPPTSPWSR